MAHNFKIVGSYYMSKSGHDSNDGLTPDTPSRSWKSSVYNNGVAIIGAGEYITTGLYAYPIIQAKADGKVILKTINNDPLHGGENSVRYYNLIFEDFAGKSFSSLTENMYMYDCVLKNWTKMGFMASGFTREPSYFRTKFLNCNGLYEGLECTAMTFDGCIFINTSIHSDRVILGATGSFRIKNSYLDSDSSPNISFSNPAFFRNNNVNGTIIFSGFHYAVKDQLIGTPQDNGYAEGVQWLTEANLTANGYTGTIAGWNTAVATCVNRDPLFNNVAFEDFSLQAGSPHIGRATGGGNIGSTNPAISVYNTSNGTSQIIPSPEIDTTNPNAYTVKEGFTEGYIDYIEKIGTANLTLREIEPITSLEFNSDIEGGQIGNRNVPDSEPLTFEYPRKLITTSLAADTVTLNVVGHDAVVGEYIRYAGQDREVISVTINVITVASAFRAAVPSGAEFQIGPKVRIGALNPNRITFMLRTSKEDSLPTTDAQWDNDIDPSYGKAGHFLTQEWGAIPGYYIDSTNNAVWGSGDSETPPGLSKNEIACKWVQIRVYIRNNYES